tara:strand:+ start:100804 stop:102051 length:1248 start_codon:yes stop_codon:yes gene_type:complete
MVTLTRKHRELFKTSMQLSRGMYKMAYPEIFGNKDRIDVPVDMDDFIESSTSYTLVKAYLDKLGYNITDYVAGYATKTGDKNQYKIGKVIKENSQLSNIFRDCSYRQNVKLVISRHPYDIACASYDQGWYSCLHPFNGDCADWTYTALKTNMLLIAYLVPDNNKKGFQKPLGRILINPYFHDRSGLIWLQPASVSYGIFSDKYRETIKKWLNDNFNNKYVLPKMYGETSFEFLFAEGLVYDNDDPQNAIIMNLNIINDRKVVRELLNRGILLQRLSFIKMRKLGDIMILDKGIIKQELKAYMDYHGLYEKGSSKYQKTMFAHYFINEIEPPRHDAYEYMEFLHNNKMKFSRSRVIEKYLEDDGWDTDQLLMYTSLFENPVKWGYGRRWLDQLKDDGDIKEGSKTYITIAKALAVL